MMEGSSVVVDPEVTTCPLTLVLVGRKGNGKSATGNSILGTNVFRSERISSGLTTSSELKTNGQMLNVIDTPGLFDSSVRTDFIANEIFNCVNMVRDGIDAFLVVFSVRCRFSKEEEATIKSLLVFLGRKLYDYMIVVFTGGDVLDKDDETLEGFLSDCPETLKETLSLCENRFVLFDNKTKDQTKKENQLHKLLSLVKTVSRKNGGKPYTNEIFTELKEQADIFLDLKETNPYTENDIHEQQFKGMLEMVQSNHKETTLSLERQLAEERAARLMAEEDAKAAKKKLDEEKRYIEDQIERVTRRLKEPLLKPVIDRCFIL